jgi:ferredoxin-fold anticodon binding domain-containing protein
MLNNSYEFDALEGKTLAELEGLGVISRFDDGSLISKSGADTFVKFNVGTKHVLSTSEVQSPQTFGLDAGLVDGMTALLRI